MTSPPDSLLKRIHATKAVSIWNHKTGPVFWYAANVPGPFYVNTELVIGPELAADLLEEITAIVARTTDPGERARQLNALILGAYQTSGPYRNVIAVMVKKAEAEFPEGGFDVISGGERRDWLFSIPLAEALGVRHVFLFKNQTSYCTDPLKDGEHALHVADLINNAASYFDKWFPILVKAKLDYIGTLCVNIRGNNGLNRLREHGKKTIALNIVDQSFFEQSLADGLIDADTLDEIKTYFASTKDWAKRYLMKDTKLFDTQNIDTKSFDRLRSFFTQDPWGLKKNHAVFFDAMQKEIKQRLTA